MRAWTVVVVMMAMVMVAACGPVGEASLGLAFSPKPFPLGGTGRLKATAIDGSGNVGVGIVHLSSSEGSLVEGVDVPIDSFGTASADFTCERCVAGRELSFDARWPQRDGKLVRASTSATAEAALVANCTVGSAASSATPDALDLFGTPVFFNGGMAIDAGRYRVRNMGGCMKYNSAQNWMTQAFADGSSAWWLIGDSTADKLFMLPGVFGWKLVNGKQVDQGAATWAECDRINAATLPREFEFAGGRLGIMLSDTIYSDNTAGDRNPTWELTRAIPGCP